MASAVAGETLHVVEREAADTTIHLSTKGETDSKGDMIVFANPIFDSTNTHQLGIVQGTCVRVIVAKSWECFFTLALATDRIRWKVLTPTRVSLSSPLQVARADTSAPRGRCLCASARQSLCQMVPSLHTI